MAEFILYTCAIMKNSQNIQHIFLDIGCRIRQLLRIAKSRKPLRGEKRWEKRGKALECVTRNATKSQWPIYFCPSLET